ncbi:hypothetical protein N7512_007696 [Penicillium capsulatum]|nr:hypothetical protein N7512_007696 [Penicillium capsulatum]
MRLTFLLPVLALTWSDPAGAVNIISSNDDGWAEANIRAFFHALTSAGHSTVVAAPAQDQSGTGKPPVGHNASEPRLNYVNSYPATSMKYGIHSISRDFFEGAPDLAVAGPNVGNNIGLTVSLSGTVGATTYAVHEAGIPGIAFSGATGSQTAWNASSTLPHYSQVYADLAVNFTNALVASGKPYLPEGIWLNVNFPSVSDECSTPDDFAFVLSRIHIAVPLITPGDVEVCGDSRLPSEIAVSLASGCYTSVSVGVASNKEDANATMQAAVLKKLGSLLTCLPSSTHGPRVELV